MKRLSVGLLASVLAGVGTAHANTCEESFREEGDPRNGAEYSAFKRMPGTSVNSALGQLSALAASDGFNVHGIEADASGGKLTIEQAKGVSRPFLIHFKASSSGNGSEVSVSTRLNRGVTARAEDMRNNMCGMLHRVKAGPEGEQIAKAATTRAGGGGPVETTAILLARDLFRLKKQVGGDQAGADTITARYKGRQYRLDGQVYEPLDQGSRVDLWYHTYRAPGILNTIEDTNSVYWAVVSCQMAADQNARALRLQGKDWAKLVGTVSHYQLGTPDKLVLKDCRFQ